MSEWNKAQFPGKKVGDLAGDVGGKEFADYIKESKNCSFMFILSNYANEQATAPDQKPQWEKWIKDNELEEYVAFLSAGISNPVHQERKYSLYVVVMQSKEHEAPLEMKGMVQ